MNIIKAIFLVLVPLLLGFVGYGGYHYAITKDLFSPK
jgi:hypothetical protein